MGGQVDHDVVPVGRISHRSGIEQVAAHRDPAEPFDQTGLLVGPGHRGDIVAGLDQTGQRSAADDTGGSGEEDLHDVLLLLMAPSSHTALTVSCSSGTVSNKVSVRSAMDVPASSRRHASSARHIAVAIPHGPSGS